MSYSNGPKIVTDGLVLCLDAGNPKSYIGSGTTWSDLSGNGYNGTLTNGPTFNSSNKGGIVLDGINDNVQVSYPTNPSYFSFELTFSMTELPINGVVVLVGKYNGSGNDYWLGLISSQLVFSTNGQTLPFGNISASNKYVATCIIGSDAKRTYLNGAFSNSASTLSCAPNGPIGIGAFGYSGLYASATVYNYRFYDRALSANEILQNYNTTKGRYNL